MPDQNLPKDPFEFSAKELKEWDTIKGEDDRFDNWNKCELFYKVKPYSEPANTVNIYIDTIELLLKEGPEALACTIEQLGESIKKDKSEFKTNPDYLVKVGDYWLNKNVSNNTKFRNLQKIFKGLPDEITNQYSFVLSERSFFTMTIKRVSQEAQFFECVESNDPKFPKTKEEVEAYFENNFSYALKDGHRVVFFENKDSSPITYERDNNKELVLAKLTMKIYAGDIRGLSPDERRQLRTSISDTDAEIYHGCYLSRKEFNEFGDSPWGKGTHPDGGRSSCFYSDSEGEIHISASYCFGGIALTYDCLRLFGKDGNYFEVYYKYGSGKSVKSDESNAGLKAIQNEYSKNIIYYGPPGTGKTREAKKLAGQIVTKYENGLNDEELEKYINIGRIKLVQFHPSYSYEDFVRGVTVTPKDGDVNYKIESKVFEDICDSANDDDPENNYVIIIDEINRAPLSTVLGELIYGIEYRGKSINSPYSIIEEGAGEKGITVPENLYIIGTMNTADRTIGSMDYAVRRRFDFKPVYARAIGEDTNGIVDNENDPDRKQIFLKASFETVFRDVSLSVARGVDPNDIMPGGSYFLANAVDSDDGIDWDHYDYKMKYELLPLLQEYSKDGMFTSRKSIDGKETLIELLRDNRYFEKLENAEKHFQRKIYYKVRSDVSKAMNEGVSLDDLMPDTECFIGEKYSVINSVCIQLSSLNKCWKRSKIDEMTMKQYLDDNGKEYKERLKAIT